MKESKKQLNQKYILNKVSRITTAKYKDAPNQICYEVELLYQDEYLKMNTDEALEFTKEYMDRKYGANQFHFENLIDNNEKIIGVKYRCHREWEMRVLFNLYNDLILNYNVKKRYFDNLLLMKQSFKKQNIDNMQNKINELEKVIFKLRDDKFNLKKEKAELLKKILYELELENQYTEKIQQLELSNGNLNAEVTKMKIDNSELLKKIYELQSNNSNLDKVQVEPLDKNNQIENQVINTLNVSNELFCIKDIKNFSELGELGQNLLIKNENVLKNYSVDEIEKLIVNLIRYKTNYVVMNSLLSKFLKGEIK